MGDCWLVRSGITAEGFAGLARPLGLRRLLTLYSLAQIMVTVFWLGSWALLGWLTLNGRLDAGWLSAWLLLLGALVPFRALAAGSGGLFSIRLGAGSNASCSLAHCGSVRMRCAGSVQVNY